MSSTELIQSRFHEEPLGDFPKVAFLKFLLRDPVVERRYYNGNLPHELLVELHRLFGGTPRFLDQMRKVLRTIPVPELQEGLAALEFPAELELGALQEIRDRYCEKIFIARLYGNLGLDCSRALSRAAVFRVPINMAGLVAVTNEPIERLRDFTQEWQNYALAYTERERSTGELWTVYGLLRTWLLAPERLSLTERQSTHRAAGNFLQELETQDREQELGLFWADCLLEARAQYLEAREYEQARVLTDKISQFCERRGLYNELARINHELLDYAEHPGPINWVGRAYMDRADYLTARKWYQRSLAASKDLLTPEVATAWHELGSIDIRVGDYQGAREKTLKSLKIDQQIGSRSGEAASWHQLASIDLQTGNYKAAEKHLTKSLEIHQQIGSFAGAAGGWHQLAVIDLRKGDYLAAGEKSRKALEIHQRMVDRAGEAASWHQLGSIDLRMVDYKAAREKFLKALTIRQQIGDRAGEAATWHQLASIDLYVGEPLAACEKFLESLKLRQRIGDRAGEAANFYQLGLLAAALGRLPEGIQLVALCALIDESIGHEDAEKDSRAFALMASKLNYTTEQSSILFQEIAKAYQADRGWGLIKAAFGKGLDVADAKPR